MITDATSIRLCERCGNAAITGRRKYCGQCAEIVIREYDRERNRVRRAEQNDKINAQSRARYAKRPGVRANYRDRVRFGGLKAAVLERDGNCCRMCGAGEGDDVWKITIHHINGDKTHNVMDNLIALCRVCHPMVHNRWQGATRQEELRAIIAV